MGITRISSGDIRDANVNTIDIVDDAVTYAKIQNVSATDKLLGRSTIGAGDVEEIACTAAGRALLDDANAAAQLATLGAAAASHTHAGTDITSGTVDAARLGSGVGALKFLRGDSTWQSIAAGGDALTTGTLAQFAATTSAELAGVLSDETGYSGGALVVFSISPVITTPTITELRGASAQVVCTFNDTGTVANYFTFQARAAAGKPRLSATGSDTDVTLVLGTKGAGTLQYAPGGTSLRDIVSVGASGETQTMVGKLVFPSGGTNATTIPDFVNSNHTHENAAGGGHLKSSSFIGGVMAISFGFG